MSWEGIPGRVSTWDIYIGMHYFFCTSSNLDAIIRNELKKIGKEAGVLKESDLKNDKAEEDDQSDNAESKKKTNLG